MRCELCNAPLTTAEIAAGTGWCKNCAETADALLHGDNVARKRGNVLLEAHEVINGQRQDQYGNPEDSFATIAKMWSAWLGKEIFPYDAAMLMALLKVARAKHGAGHRDNHVDGCGYLALAADMAKDGKDA